MDRHEAMRLVGRRWRWLAIGAVGLASAIGVIASQWGPGTNSVERALGICAEGALVLWVAGWLAWRVRRTSSARPLTPQALAKLPRIPLHALLDLTLTIKVVDIGANPIDGEPPYSRLLTDGHAHVVGFEPNPEALAVLRKRMGPNENYLPNAIGDGSRQTLRHCVAPGMTSLFQPNAAVLALFYGFPEWGRVLRTEEIDTIRLDDVPETESLDLLKIDIQGGELMVFQNALERLASAVVIQTEVEFLEMYVGQPLFADVDTFLRERGFVFHKFEPLVSRVLQPFPAGDKPKGGLSQLAWADAIYVKDLTRLDRFASEQLLRAATILHDCYRSYDLVMKLLREYDRRSGTAYEPKYLRHLAGGKA